MTLLYGRVFMFSNMLVKVSGCVADWTILETHGDTSLLNESQFQIIWKCQGKFDCQKSFIIHMLVINKLFNCQSC